MAIALFISEQFLRDYTPISSNVDVDFIWPHIKAFQDTNIQLPLGSKLYNTLQTKIAASTALNSYETALLDLCRMALAWGTLSQMIPFLAIQIRNKGVMENNSENSASADLEKIKYIRHEAQNMYEFYTQRVLDYLCDNGNQFPDYINPDNPIAPSNGPAYDSDLWLGGQSNDDFDALAFWRKYIK